MNAETGRPLPLFVWWVIWLALTTGVVVLWRFLGSDSTRPPADALRYLPVAPFALSMLMRWLVLPRFTEALRAFPIFVIGLALSESCAILGIFVVPELRDTYVALGLLGLAQYVPVFASKLR